MAVLHYDTYRNARMRICLEYTMKKLFLLVAFAFVYTGCHPTPEPSAVSPESTESTSDASSDTTGTTPAPAPAKVAEVGTEWQFFYKERRTNPPIIDVYKRALKLVKDQTGTEGTLGTTSRHIGDWYLIQIEIEDKTPPEMIPTDVPAPERERAYLVDMAAEKVVQPGDMLAARPFFRGSQLDKHIPSADPDIEKTYLGSIAASLSAVSFSHTRYIEPIQGQVFPPGVTGPRLSAGPNGAVFTYYIHSTGMNYFITECILKVSDTKFEFASDIMRPDEPSN
jgi:hypothetical protein